MYKLHISKQINTVSKLQKVTIKVTETYVSK